MMKFDCPHCGQQLIHQKVVAGREGWCRFCKCILVMPQPGEKAVRPILTLQQQFAQLERMFRFAAGIVDEHRQLQASLTNGKQGLADAIQSRADAERSAEALRKEMGRNKTTQAQLEAECNRLADQLDQSMSNHAVYQSESEKRMAQVKLELNAHESRDGVLLGRVLAIEEDINQAEHVAKESFDERDALLRSRSAARAQLEKAQEAEAALKERIEEADARERALHAEFAEQKGAMEESRLEFEEEYKRLSALYTAELSQRQEVEERVDEALRSAEKVPDLERELAEARASLESADERHRGLNERYNTLEQSLETAQTRQDDSREGWEEQRQQLCDEVEHYRLVLQKVDQDLAAMESQRQKNESLLQTRFDEKQIELLRETALRVKTERLHESVSRELAESKAAFASAEENLHLLRQSTDSLKSEIGTAIQAKVV